MNKIVLGILFLFIIGFVSVGSAANVANWKMNEGTGTWVNDSSGYNNNGTITNTTQATWSTDAVNVSSIAFAGLNNSILFPGSSSLNDTFNGTSYTITSWIKLRSAGMINIFAYVDKDGKNNQYFVDSGQIGIWVNNSFVLKIDLPDSGNNTWHLYAFRRNGSVWSVFRDNTQIGADVTDSRTTYWSQEGYRTGSIGGDPTTQPSDSIHDEIRLYNHSLSASELTTVYQEYQPVPAYPTGGIILSSAYPPQTTSVTFSWHDIEYPGDRLQVAIDSSFNLLVVDITTTNDYYLATLPSGDTYYWKVRQYNGTSDTYGDTSDIETFSISSASSATGQGVQGVIYELINGVITPINEVQVHIYNSTYSNFMITGSNGYYLFDGIANDTYQVYAVKQDYDTTAALPVTVNGSLTTQDILMNKYISPYIPNFVYEKLVVVGLFDNAFSGVTVNVYEGDSLTVSQTGTTDSLGAIVFRLFKDRKYRVVFSGGGIGSDLTIYYVFAKEETYTIRIITGFPTGGDRNSDITANLTSITINATHSNLSLLYNDTTGTTSQIYFYTKNLSTNVTCYLNSTLSVVTLGCPVIASGKYQFGYNATTTKYGYVKQDKIINFDVGKPSSPAISTNIDSTLLQWASIILIVLTASLFSVKSVKFGAVIVPFEALVLWAFGWFEPIQGNSIGSLLLISIATCLGIMVYLRLSETKAVYQ